MDRQSRPLTGEALPQGKPMGAAFRAREFRRSASLFLGVRRVRNRQFGTTARRDAPRGNAPARLSKMHMTNVGFWRNEPEISFWRNEPKLFGGRTVLWRNEPEISN